MGGNKSSKSDTDRTPNTANFCRAMKKFLADIKGERGAAKCRPNRFIQHIAIDLMEMGHKLQAVNERPYIVTYIMV